MNDAVLVDTNIVCYLLLDSEKTMDAQTLFRCRPNWISEAFLLVELSNVLATAVRTDAIVKRQAITALRQVQEIFNQSSLHHANNEKALEAAIQYKVSAYDVRFLAVAIETGLRLTTEDKRLRVAAPELTQSLAEALARTD